MTPEQIRNQCEDDADHTPSDLTVWRDRGVIIAAQQTRIAQLEAQVEEARWILQSDAIVGRHDHYGVNLSCKSCAWLRALS